MGVNCTSYCDIIHHRSSFPHQRIDGLMDGQTDRLTLLTSSLLFVEKSRFSLIVTEADEWMDWQAGGQRCEDASSKPRALTGTKKSLFQAFDKSGTDGPTGGSKEVPTLEGQVIEMRGHIY